LTAVLLLHGQPGSGGDWDGVVAAIGGRLEAVEFGTDARHPVDSTLDIVLPPAFCWAYPADERADIE